MTLLTNRLNRQIRRILFTLIIFNVFPQAQGQVNNFTLQFNRIMFSDLADTIEKIVPVKLFYIDKWTDSLYLSIDEDITPEDRFLDRILRKTGLNFIITEDNKVILTKDYKIKTTFRKEYMGYLKENIKNPTDTATYLRPPPEQDSKLINDEYRLFRIGKQSGVNLTGNAVLSGSIFSQADGEVIAGAIVYIKELKAGAITNANGFYSMNLPVGQYQIEYRTVGMKTATRNVIILSSGTLDIEMEKSIMQLDEVSVYANRQNNVKSVTPGIEKINAKMLKQIPMGFGEVDVIKSSLLLPGVQSAGEASAGFNVRGGSTDQNLILLDQAPIINTSHFFGFFSALNSDLISDVTLYKSGMPAKYGGRISSVMDIVTTPGSNEKLKVRGGISPVTGRLLVEGPIQKNKSSFIIGSRATYSDWLLGFLKDKQLQKSRAGFADIQGLVTYNINNKNSISLSVYYSNDRFNYYKENDINYGNFASTLRWKHTFSPRLSLQTYAVISNYNYKLNNTSDSTSFSSLNYELKQKILRMDFLYFPGRSHKLEFGIYGNYYSLLPGVMEPVGSYSRISSESIEKERALEPSFYVSDEFEVSPAFSLSGGIRGTLFTAFGPKTTYLYDPTRSKTTGSITDTIRYNRGQIIKTYPDLEFRASSRLILANNFSVKAGIQRVYQYLHMISNTTSMSPTDIWKLSDIYFKPQMGDQFSLGFYNNLRRIGLDSSVELYYKKLSNIIDYKGGAELIMNDKLETDIINGSGKAYGIEFMINKKAGIFTGWMSYTYSRTLWKVDGEFNEEKLNGGNYFPSNYDKPHDFKLVVNAKLARRINITSNYAYSTGRPITYPVAFYKFNDTYRIYYSNRNQFRIPDYMRLDISITLNGNLRERKMNHSSLSATVYNLLGRKNPYSIFFKNEGGEINGYQMTIFAQPFFMITYNFRLFGNARDDF